MAQDTWIRARSDKQIDQRLGEIIDATSRLYEQHRFEDVTLVMIAKDAGFTRSNLYRYFHTKEEVFLELLKHDLDEWSTRVAERIGNVQTTAADLAAFWINELRASPRMLKLLSILYTALEPNVTLEALISFKSFLGDMMARTALSIVSRFPTFSNEAVTEFLYVQASLAIGTHPLTDLTEKQHKAAAATGMKTDPDYYWGMLEHTTMHLIEGLTHTCE